MRRKREELRENVIIAARNFIYYGLVDGRPCDPDLLRGALIELDEYDAAELTGQGAKWVEGSPETSRDAAIRATPVAYSTRYAIIDLLARAAGHANRVGGYTDEALETRTGGKHQTVSSARNWLVEAGWVRDSGLRRKTRSNREAVVWELTPAAWLKWKEGM